jgi:signal transduction histidine kinase
MTAMASLMRHRHQWIFCVVALGVWLSQGWPVLMAIDGGMPIRGSQVSALWIIPFLLFGAAVLGAMALRPRPSVQWALIGVQLAAVVAMAIIAQWAGMSSFLVIIAWQVALITSPVKAFAWAAFQTLVIIGTLALSRNPDLCWVITKSFALQLLLVLTAIALWREAETARKLAQTNRELQSAQAIIANTARSVERLRISRELHDAWGHELTALGLQLEIASHVSDPARANEHVVKARGLARDLLANVRDVVATLREADRCDLKHALEALAESVPTPVIHVDVAPELRVGPDQAHALVRCAQEAITNAVKHADASNLWLRVTPDGDGVRLIARNDGRARGATSSPGSGLLGMRERLEHLGGRLAVQKDVEVGFTIDAWLPAGSPRSA